jgi:hypothetical protein
MLEELEKQEEDEEILKELKESKKDKSFPAVINKRRLNKFELDEAME